MALDEATAGFLTQLAESGAKPLHELTPEEARGFTAMLRDLFGPGPDVEKSYDVQLPTAVKGDSADGNLSAVVAQKARDAGGPELAAQVLIYPVTDADLDNSTYSDPENQLMLTRDAMIWFWDHYAPDQASRQNPDASPLQAGDLTGLAPAIVVNLLPGSADGIAYVTEQLSFHLEA